MFYFKPYISLGYSPHKHNFWEALRGRNLGLCREKSQAPSCVLMSLKVIFLVRGSFRNFFILVWLLRNLNYTKFNKKTIILIFAVTASWVAKESKIVATTKSKKSIIVVTIKKNLQPKYFSWYHFLRKNEIRDYFYWIGWISYKFEWLTIFIFLFYNRLVVE